MYLQEIETKSKKLGEFHSVKNTVDWFSPYIYYITLLLLHLLSSQNESSLD